MKRCIAPYIVLFGLLACDDPFEANSARPYKSIATGGDHSCAVSEDGAAYCWGRGLDGELGIGVKENRSTPARVKGSLVFDEITAGDNHTCALTQSGEAFCWGFNLHFQRGNDSDPRDSEPVPVKTTVRFTTISAGAHHTCGVALDSLAYCWGYNQYGQIGDSTANTAITPQRVQSTVKFIQISSGAAHTCAVARDARLYCWGRNDFGQLGTGSLAVSSSFPVPVSSTNLFKQVDAGVTHTCAVAESGSLYCWGSSEYGELGDGSGFKSGLPAALIPRPVSSLLSSGLSISAGQSHTCAVTLPGTGACWGRGLYGQLANGSTGDNFFPQPVHLQPGLQHGSDQLAFSMFATGGRTHACGLADQSVFCWGTGPFGQLGVAGSSFALLPQRVAD